MSGPLRCLETFLKKDQDGKNKFKTYLGFFEDKAANNYFDFWNECARFRKLELSERLNSATQIYLKYLKPKTVFDQQIELEDGTISRIEKDITNDALQPSTFTAAQEEALGKLNSHFSEYQEYTCTKPE